MRRKDDEKGVPPPLEEVDVDEFDQVTGAGPFDDFLGIGGLGSFGFGAPPMGFGTGGDMASMMNGLFAMNGPNPASTIKTLSAMLDLSDRRHGGGNGRHRR